MVAYNNALYVFGGDDGYGTIVHNNFIVLLTIFFRN
jgi:hypothetical protein